MVTIARRGAALLLAGMLLAPWQAPAQGIGSVIADQLREQGYQQITQGRTLLGRQRILAVRDGIEREIVFNPVTGEILRDFQSGPSDLADQSGGSAVESLVTAPVGDPAVPEIFDPGPPSVETTRVD